MISSFEELIVESAAFEHNGKHRYRGPKPPFFMKKPHRYQFHFYVLDCLLALDSNTRRAGFMQRMEGHIVQYGSIMGLYKNE